MKKIIFFILFSGLVLADPSVSFSAETETKEQGPGSSEAIQGQQNPARQSDEQTSNETLQAKDFHAVSETEVSGATVSASMGDILTSSEGSNSVGTTQEKETTASGLPSEYSVAKKVLPNPPEESAVPASSDVMQKRWDALLSKEIAPGSISYTVKAGDSLYVIANKNHTTVAFIKKLNALESDTIYPNMKLKIQVEPFSMTVDKSDNTLTLYAGGSPIKKYRVATGKNNSTPVGEFKIVNKLVNPTWFKAGAILPPGSPKNALGTRWMGFDKPAYGIHGTIEPKTIGTQVSEGCIRMLNQDVEEIYAMVPAGTKVIVQD